MIVYWILAASAAVVILTLLASRRRAPALPVEERRAVEDEPLRVGQQDLGANVNPSATGNLVNLWPDRTGPQTRYELGATDTTDMTFAGDRPEQKEPPHTNP